MTRKVKTGLNFGITMAVVSIGYDLLFKAHDNSSKSILLVIIIGVLGGALAGVLYAWFIGKFFSSKSLHQSTVIDLLPQEVIILEGPANHFKGPESGGGKLFLTSERLVFKSHELNIHIHELSIDIAGIVQARSYKVLGFVRKGLSVTTVQQKEEKFVVEKPDKWVKLLSEKNAM